jgi:hypothetical protein
MERKKASDYPQELLNLFDKYVHGDIGRRDFLDGAQKFAVGGLTATAIWESLRPNYAWAEQIPRDDKRLKTERVTVPSPQGNGEIKGYFVRPANASGKLPGILVIHENRGLNPYIEDVARRLGTIGYMAFAADGLTSVGGYPGDEEKAAAMFGPVDKPKMTEDFIASARWLKGRPDCTGKIGLFGDGFSLHELQQVVRPAGLRIGPDILNPPKRCAPTMAPVHLRLIYRFPTKNSSRALDFLPIVGIHRAGQPVLGIVGQLQRMVEIASLGHRQHRSENLFLKMRAFESTSAITVGCTKYPSPGPPPPAISGLPLSHFDVIENRFLARGPR